MCAEQKCDMEQRISMTADEQKEVMLNILLEVAKFCDEHGLTYFLDAGTLIGAVRHKGFIPWDDDVDICMMREDFDTFMELMQQKGDWLTDHIFLERPENIMYPFPKIADNRTILVEHPEKKPEEVAVYIDIFPKDYIKDKKLSSRLLCKMSGFYELLQWFNHYSIYAWETAASPLKRAVAWCGRKVIRHPNWGVKHQQKLITRHNRRVNPSQCKYVTTLVRGEFHKLAPVECFSEAIPAQFEGCNFQIPVGYDEYLHCLYKGDYMQIPPEADRKWHDTVIYWKSASARKCFYEEKEGKA